MEGEWAQISGDQIQAVLGVCGVITKYDLQLTMCLLVCCIVELDNRVKQSGHRASDMKLEEIIADMIRGHTLQPPVGETAGSA